MHIRLFSRYSVGRNIGTTIWKASQHHVELWADSKISMFVLKWDGWGHGGCALTRFMRSGWITEIRKSKGT